MGQFIKRLVASCSQAAGETARRGREEEEEEEEEEKVGVMHGTAIRSI